MIEKLALPEIRELIAENDEITLSDVLNDWHPADLSALVDELEPKEELAVLRSLTIDLRAETFGYLDLEVQERIIDAGSDEEIAPILNQMPPDDRTALLDELPSTVMHRLIGLLNPAEKAVAVSLLGYPEDSIGRLMTPEFVAIEKDWKVDRVLEHIRTHGKDSETLNVIYVVDSHGKLIDDLRIREILLAAPTARVADLIDDQYVHLHVGDNKRQAVDIFKKYDRTALPVVNPHGKLVGIVTIDDVIDVAEEAATQQIQQFGGLEALDEPYTSTPLLLMVRKRATWLVILFLSEMLTATAMGFFEAEIAKAVVLALFVPLIISSGGNSGSQAATLIIRALALGEIKIRDWRRVLGREVASGLMLGGLLGTIGFARIALWSAFSTIYGPHWVLIGVTVAISLLGIVLWGTISGSMLPFVLKSLGLDPATSSAPFVATLVDVTGLVIYFTVALVVLKGTLL